MLLDLFYFVVSFFYFTLNAFCNKMKSKKKKNKKKCQVLLNFIFKILGVLWHVMDSMDVGNMKNLFVSICL